MMEFDTHNIINGNSCNVAGNSISIASDKYLLLVVKSSTLTSTKIIVI